MNTNITEKENRKYLKELSAKAKEMVDGENFRHINNVLIKSFYKTEQHQTFQTMEEWNSAGYQVNKGAKAFPIWGKPIERPNKEVEGETYTYFPIRSLFSNSQVTKRENI